MGAASFNVDATGPNAAAAFREAVQNALHEEGHGGYTGTLAEKDSFVMIPLPEEHKTNPARYAEQLLDEDDERIADKWGPAGCIDLGGGNYLFFGWSPT